MLLWATWNLFLAVLPLPFARALARRLERGSGTAPARAATLVLAAAWLLLLPNAPYLLTDVRHFVLDASWRDMAAEARSSPGALRATAAWGFVFLAYGGVGTLAMVAAVRPVERALRVRRVSPTWFRAVLFPLLALGVWLGLIPRYDSWDALVRPLDVLGSTARALSHLPTAASIAAFALVLAMLHVLLDSAWRGLRLREEAREPA